jgi:microcystin-dependent protein
MASTYTTNLRLTKQGDGDNPNSWGQILNDGVISLADAAITGYTAIAVGTTANVTLTANDGAGDQARSAFLEFTGTVGGSHDTINILIPAKSKSYSVLNKVAATDSTDVIMMKVAGHTGVTLSRSSTLFQHVVCDGTSVRNVAQADGEFGSLTVSGNTAIAGAVSIGGTLLTTGAVKLNSTVSVSGAATFNSTVTVSGAATFKSAVSVSGATAFGSTVTVVGAAVFKSNVSIGGTLTGGGAVPSGTFFPYAGASAPSGYLLSFGQAISRSTYADLFSAISTTYGVGDGSSTFNVPDLRGRVVAGQDDMGGTSANRLTGTSGSVNGDTLGGTGGAETHTLTTAQLAAHTHGWAYAFDDNYDGGNIPVVGINANSAVVQSAETITQTASTGGGGAHNNVQPTIILNYIIKT